MVEDTTTNIKTQTCQLNDSLQQIISNGRDVEMLEKNKTNVISLNKIKSIHNDYIWNVPGKKFKRRSEDHLSNDVKKAKNDDDAVELLEELKEEVFNWNSYLEETAAKQAPKSIFKHIVPECMCGFESGMKLEVPNKDHKNTYWLATIIAKAPPLILVRYEGFQESNNSDFWCNTLSDDMHPVGWCARTKHALKPPKAIQHKEKNWYAYLIKHLTGARKASESLFLKKSHPAHYLRAGQYIEVLDPYNPTCYWLARIVEVFAGRLNLQYEGWEDKKCEVWVYYLNENLRPVGHGIKHGLTLYPPQDSGSFTHTQFSRITGKLLVLSKRDDNTLFKSLFVGWPNKKEHNVRLGMKLEAVHPSDPTSIHVASVARIFDHYYFLIKIDNLLSTQDEFIANSFVTHKEAPYIFPIGFCAKNGVMLHQPKGYIGKFTWDGYLKYTKCEPIPESFFPTKQKDLGLEVGMKLEAIDKENRANICVSTISKVLGDHIWLNIDGDTRSDQIFHVTSHDIFPVGWCEATGHELQWPRPNTLEQKNRISSLRHTATRKNRLEVLRKGKLHEKGFESKEKNQKGKEKRQQKSRHYLKGRRGVSRNRIVYDEKNDSTTDTSIAIVCINRLAEEFNSEESIKRHFHLDAEGRLPAEIVTIDDDDDDGDKETTKQSNSCKYTEEDLNYLSFIRVKPNDLNKKENEMFETKVRENDGNRGGDLDALLTANSSREKRSLSTVVAMLRANRRTPGKSHLLEQYKQSKSKKTEDSGDQPSNNNEKINKKEIRKNVIDLCDDAGDDEENALNADAKVVTQDGAIKIPGKGEYRIVEKIVTKHGDKNKIILKLGKAMQHDVSGSQLAIVNSQSVSASTTNVDDMNLLSNMARSHPGLDEVMKHRFIKVRSMCKELPKNPLNWTKKNVATFIHKADQAKYAKLFYDQEVDGHSLLLLTVQEIHHILGVHLGPAMKIHDYIYTLQQLVNDAYLNNNVKQGGTMTHDSDSIVLERESVANSATDDCTKSADIADTCTMFPNMDVVHWLNTSVLPENEKRDMTLQENNIPLKKAKIEPDTNILPDEKKVSTEVEKVIPLSSEVEKATDNNIVPFSIYEKHNQFKMIPMSEFNFLPPYSMQALRFTAPHMQMTTSTAPLHMVQYRPSNIQIGSEFPVRFGTQLIPIQYIPEQAKETVSAVSTPNETLLSPVSSVQPLIIPHIPSTLKRPAEMIYPVPVHIPIMSPDTKSDTTTSQKSKVPVNPLTTNPISVPVPSFPTGHPWFQQYLLDVDIELESKELWDGFHKHGTEMILTRIGRRMFPTLQITVTGMDPKAKYVIIVDFSPADHYRYKYEYEASQWLIACEETTPPPGRVYIHPESPATGEEWMKNTVDFTKCKLTNNIADKRGHVLMQSMHKYQPRIHIIYWDGSLPLQINPFELLRVGCRKEFVFLQTQFIAVTAYQNSQITQLKIASNPFARGFRGDWRKFSNSEKPKKRAENEKNEEFSSSTDKSDSNVMDKVENMKMEEVEHSDEDDEPMETG